MKKINSKQEGNFAIISAFIVLFSAMWDPIVSVIVSISALVLFAIYKFLQKK
jgi:hypothetical protein